ncbi:MAG: MFS transporter [Candidatus Latescibacteria bacterium]|nr:MFS transporter [Candidatus Latescibacterota bacterium]
MTYVLLRPDPLTLARKHAGSFGKVVLEDSVRPLKEIFSDPTVRYATTSMVIGQLVMTLLMVITPLHMNHNAHSTQTISLVIMAHAMGMFGLSNLTGWLVIRYGRESVIRLGVVTLIVSSVLTPVSPQFVPLALALFLLGIGWNFCFIAGSSLLADSLAPNEKGRVQGANEMFISISASLGSMGTGIAFVGGGIVACAVIGFVCSLGLGVYSIIYGRRTRTDEQELRSA